MWNLLHNRQRRCPVTTWAWNLCLFSPTYTYIYKYINKYINIKGPFLSSLDFDSQAIRIYEGRTFFVQNTQQKRQALDEKTVRELEKEATCPREPSGCDHDSNGNKDKRKKPRKREAEKWVSVSFKSLAQMNPWPLAFSWGISTDNVAFLATFHLSRYKEWSAN